ncbi:hypothetical protein I6N95_07850 [Vagococcus sp. BWB3-3]|uniref:Uncharacterized protein n=1 Tax=Vagococcus allomyrinae TaxID=2794353 RepID=A0A940P9H0_9ENTE|nr:hypothetical protein [Vagococcus allomyrinae]MBP1040914.1 hypothetical protein [Vagococcus allomyrinae]
MLTLLFLLSTISFVLIFLMPFVQKKDLGKLYTTLTLLQGGSIGATFGILLVMLIKGRSF